MLVNKSEEDDSDDDELTKLDVHRSEVTVRGLCSSRGQLAGLRALTYLAG